MGIGHFNKRYLSSLKEAPAENSPVTIIIIIITIIIIIIIIIIVVVVVVVAN